MKTETVRHSLLAYLLLATILWCLWLAIGAPLKAHWLEHKSRTAAIAGQLQVVEEQALQARRSSTLLQDRLSSLLADGQLSPGTRPAEAAHILQEGVKKSLQETDATVLQLRPSTLEHSTWLAQNKLEISFRLRADQLPTLLMSLERIFPKLHIELLSLRQAVSPTAAELPELDGALAIVTWQMRAPLAELVDLSGAASSGDKLTDKTLPMAQMPPLAGLFSAAYRARLQSPSPSHYRLAAVTLSADARIAVIADVISGTTRRLREGEMLDSWKIEAIGQNSVKLVFGERQELLELQSK